MNIFVKIFNCNWYTYKKFYKDAVKRAYKKDGIVLDESDQITPIIENLEGTSIQAQRAPSGRHSRTISVYEGATLKYIIGFSNTGFDEDKRREVDERGGKYIYGNNDFHSNTYLFQGINKIFEYYFDSKKEIPGVKLYFYLLDTDSKTYPNSLSNLMNYRKLATIGFDILNIDEIDFKNFRRLGFDPQEKNSKSISYISFNKFTNDILYISRTKKSNNVPSYLKCIDEKYDISKESDSEYDNGIDDRLDNQKNEKYIYTFKTLGAEAYDSMLTMWTLYVLAKKEHKKLEFEFSSEKYNFRLGQENHKMTTDFPDTIKTLFKKANLDINYVSSDEVLQQFNREQNQYLIASNKGILRNQELFKNNLREKGVPIKCYLCGCEIESILEAAHLWGVANIRQAGATEVNAIIENGDTDELIDKTNPHHKEMFYKKYALANSGDNGVWLCRNHHGLFDKNFFCFDSVFGKILIRIDENEGSKEYFIKSLQKNTLGDDILTTNTKLFLQQRNTALFSTNNEVRYSEINKIE